MIDDVFPMLWQMVNSPLMGNCLVLVDVLDLDGDDTSETKMLGLF